MKPGLVAAIAVLACTTLAAANDEKSTSKARAVKPLGLRNVMLSDGQRLGARDCAALGATVIRLESCESGLACYNQPKGDSVIYAVCIQ